MKEYKVSVPEIVNHEYIVKANSLEEAMKIIIDSYTDYDNQGKYIARGSYKDVGYDEYSMHTIFEDEKIDSNDYLWRVSDEETDDVATAKMLGISTRYEDVIGE